MEVALLTRFLGSTILFSLMYDKYEENLKRELWLCHKNMNLSIETLERLPVSDRKLYIRLHNKEIDREKSKLNKKH